MAGSELLNKDKLPDPVFYFCKNCPAKFSQKVFGQTIVIGCPKCGTLYKIKSGELQKEFQFKNRSVRSIIPLGSKAAIDEVNYEVIGYLYCKEENYAYYWSEYVLFNPVYGYAFISEYDGHWSFNVETDDIPGNNEGNSILLGGETFHIFNKYKSQVVFAAGEFHWDIVAKKKPEITEYINPPEMLFRERTEDTLQWFKARYLQPSEIKRLFKIDNLPARTGVAPHQPYEMNVPVGKVRTFIYGCILIMLFLQIYFINGARNQVVFDQTFPVPDTSFETTGGTFSPPQPFVGTFTLKDSYAGTSNLQVDLASVVSNNWMEAGITMVNQRTGESFAFDIGVEYYYGPGWSEGSNSEYKVLSKIPDGEYQISIQPFSGTGMGKATDFRLTFTQDVTNWSNFFLLMTALLVIPVYQWFRMRSFETKRWSNSDFSD